MGFPVGEGEGVVWMGMWGFFLDVHCYVWNGYEVGAYCIAQNVRDWVTLPYTRTPQNIVTQLHFSKKKKENAGVANE